MIRLGFIELAFQINPKIKEWTLTQFRNMFINNAELSDKFVIDLDKLFIFLKNYQFDPLDEIKRIQVEAKTKFIMRGGNHSRKKKNSYSKRKKTKLGKTIKRKRKRTNPKKNKRLLP